VRLYANANAAPATVNKFKINENHCALHGKVTILVVHTYEPGDLPENLFGAAEGCGRNESPFVAVCSFSISSLCIYTFLRGRRRGNYEQTYYC